MPNLSHLTDLQFWHLAVAMEAMMEATLNLSSVLKACGLPSDLPAQELIDSVQEQLPTRTDVTKADLGF